MKRARRHVRVLSTSAFIGALVVPGALSAQGRAWDDVSAGSDNELYVRSLQLLGVLPASAWSSRPLANIVLDAEQRLATATHPWASRFAPHSQSVSVPARLSWRGIAVETGFNSAFPWGGNDGARWQGKGVSATVTSGALMRWKILTLRVEPVFVYARNESFDVLETSTDARRSTFADRMRPNSIDLPDRFGNKPLQRLDLGESEVRVETHGLAMALSNRALFFGPAIRNPLILGNNAPGFLHLTFGTTDGVKTPVGRLGATVAYARLAQSAFAPDLREGARLSAATVLSWRPPSGKGIEIGAVRFYHRDWPADGLKLGDLKLPFGSLFGDREVQGVAAVDNQLLSLFARAASVQTGLEVFGEFGRNDRSANLRDLMVEPEHNSAWSAGLLKTFRSRQSTHFFSARAEYLNGRVTSLQRFRPQATFYEHFTLTQGHTHLGQLLGSPLLERTGGFEIAIDRWSPSGKLGIMVQQRLMPLLETEGVAPLAARSQWALEFTGNRAVRTRELGWRTGIAWDLNRSPGHDGRNLFVGLSARYRRY